jgi:hypothetical protein
LRQFEDYWLAELSAAAHDEYPLKTHISLIKDEKELAALTAEISTVRDLAAAVERVCNDASLSHSGSLWDCKLEIRRAGDSNLTH